MQAVETRADGTPSGVRVLSALGRERHGRRVADLEKKADPPEPASDAPWAERMAYRVATEAGRTRYQLRQQTLEPIFGIIKAAMGFRASLAPSGATLRAAFGRLSRSARLRLRGLAGAATEWTLVPSPTTCAPCTASGRRCTPPERAPPAP